MAKSSLKTLGEVSALAKDVYAKLISKYNDDDQKFVDDECEKSGLILSCVGSVTLLLLATNFEDIGKDQRWQKIVRREFDLVLQHVEEKGYDATPYVTEKITEKLFSKSAGHHYTDSLSWVLSLTVLIRVATYRKKILEATPAFVENVHDLMKEVLVKICDAACEKGGWNFTNGCTAPHLYYSFAITEALADFGDYVLGETPRIFSKNSKEEAEDRELLKILTGPLVERVNEKRRLTLEYLKEKYLHVLGENEIQPVEVPGEVVPNDHLLLYYTYFVIEMLVTCNLPEFHPEWADEIDEATELAIYLSRLDLTKAIKDKEWFGSPKQSTLDLSKWSLLPEANLIPARGIEIGEPGLIPLSVRCNAQYAYYVAEGKDAIMGKLLKLLLDDRTRDPDRKDKLWDKATYNLLITERAVEAIVDYNDYLSEYERESAAPEGEEAKQSKLDAAFRQMIREEVHAYASSSTQLPPGLPILAAPTAAVLDEQQLANKLISVLATIQQYSLEGDHTDLPIGEETSQELEDGLRRFLNNLIVGSLAGDLDKEKREDLRKGLKDNMKSLIDTLRPWLEANPKTKFGALFSYLQEQYAGTARGRQSNGAGEN